MRIYCPVCGQLHPLAQCAIYARATGGLKSFIRQVFRELPDLELAHSGTVETWEQIFELYASIPGVELADDLEWNIWFPGRVLDGMRGARELVFLSVEPHMVRTVWDLLLPKLRIIPGVKRARWRVPSDKRGSAESIVIHTESRQSRDRVIAAVEGMLKRRRVGGEVAPGELREEFFQLGVAKGSAPVGGLKGVSIATIGDAKPVGISIAQVIGEAWDRLAHGSNEDEFVGAVLNGMVENGLAVDRPWRRLRLGRGR